MDRRVRDLIQSPDGSVMAVTDDKAGELLKITTTHGTN
jgi:glucose/arabinose dehydrogenase